LDTVGAVQTLQVLEALVACGADGAALCRAARIDRANLSQGARRVPWRSVRTLFAEAGRQTRDPLIGLHAGAATRARGLIRYAQMSAETVGEGLEGASRAVRHGAGPLRMALERGHPVGWLRLAIDAPPHPAARPMIEYLAGLQIRLLKDVVGERFRPTEVRFPHRPAAPRAAYERVLEAPVRFQQADCRIGITAKLLDSATPTANRRLSQLVSDEITRELRAADATSIRERVERTLGEGLVDPGRGSRSRVARLLGVSERTLQRGLAREGATFRETRTSVQRELAEQMLEGTTLSISAIAAQLGFVDGAAFGKAFRRWTGHTPSAQRERAQRLGRRPRVRGAGSRS
jgi:AraC-like DNA-binding protein